MAGIQSLPQELLEHIIDSSRDPKVLKVLSTLSKAWRTRFEYDLFERCALENVHLYEIYFQISKPTADSAAKRERISTLFSYAYRLRINGEKIYPGRKKLNSYPKVLQLFPNVTHLEIQLWDFEMFNNKGVVNLLGHFGKTVTTLEITHCWDNSAVLLFLKSLFPLVDDFRVSGNGSDWPTYIPRIRYFNRPGSAVFRGKLALKNLGERHDGFLKFFDQHRSGVHSITVENCNSLKRVQNLCSGPQASELTSVGFGPGLSEGKFIHVRYTALVLTWSLQAAIDLSSCIQLRTLSIHIMYGLSRWDWWILRTVTSTHLEEVRISFFREAFQTWDYPKFWRKIENLLCEWYDRSCENENDAGRFHVVLNPIGKVKGARRWLVEQVRGAWPNFLQKGTVYLPFKPWILGRRLHDM